MSAMPWEAPADTVFRSPYTGYNYWRDPSLMAEDRLPETITIPDDGVLQDDHVRLPPPSGPARFRGTSSGNNSSSEGNGNSSSRNNDSDSVPPIAIPYMAIHNACRKDTDSTAGCRWIIFPMVAGFESTFLANTLQGLLCLPGCESVLIGDPATAEKESRGGERSPPSPDEVVGAASSQGSRGDDRGDDELGGGALRSSTFSGRLPPLPPLPPPSFSCRVTDGIHKERGNVSTAAGAPVTGVASLVASSTVLEGANALHDGSHPSSGDGVLRGGIRSQWGTPVPTAASSAYASYVQQHLRDIDIRLENSMSGSGVSPADLTGAEVDPAGVTEQQMDDAEELECLRGQTAVIPRSLPPVTLPQDPKDPSMQRAGEDRTEAERGMVDKTPMYLSPPYYPFPSHLDPSATTEPADHRPHPHRVLPITTTTSVHTALTPTPVPIGISACGAALAPDKNVPLVSDAPSSEDNSPTPSSREEYEEEEGGSCADCSAMPGRTAAASAAGTRMAHRHVAHDSSRYRCFASNCVHNMPSYPFRQLHGDDMAELAAFMVTRSCLQPDEATDLQFGAHVLGDPGSLRLLPSELQATLLQRATRLLEAAIFLQV